MIMWSADCVQKIDHSDQDLWNIFGQFRTNFIWCSEFITLFLINHQKDTRRKQYLFLKNITWTIMNIWKIINQIDATNEKYFNFINVQTFIILCFAQFYVLETCLDRTNFLILILIIISFNDFIIYHILYFYTIL